VLPLNEKQI
jgi:hypothetical protein